MHLLIYTASYLTIGAFVMIVINELLYGIVTRREFISGMLVWPLLVVGFFTSLASAYLTRGRLR